MIRWMTLAGALLAAAISSAQAHQVHYDVLSRGVSVKVFYGPEDPASYSAYEIFGPGDAEPFATGRSDRRGVVSFLPDRPGAWRVKVLGESTHGFHGATVQVQVNEQMAVASFGKPLVARHTRLITGLGVLFGLFGLAALLSSRRRPGKRPSP